MSVGTRKRDGRRAMRLVGGVMLAAWLGNAGAASAQEYFPRFDFHLGSKYVTSDDPQFNWMFDFGGELHLVHVGPACATFVAEYEAVAGEQFRRFDVNQGNYLLEGALLFRVAGVELGPVWHHVSRHLSDRAKRFPIDWNMLAFRARGDHQLAGLAAAWRADARLTVLNSFVDYTWEADAAGELGYPLSRRFAFIASSGLRVVGTDGTRERGTQLEARVEAGVRIEGSGAAAELFVGAERRLDPDPTAFGTASWLLTGLRLTGR